MTAKIENLTERYEKAFKHTLAKLMRYATEQITERRMLGQEMKPEQLKRLSSRLAAEVPRILKELATDALIDLDKAEDFDEAARLLVKRELGNVLGKAPTPQN